MPGVPDDGRASPSTMPSRQAPYLRDGHSTIHPVGARSLMKTETQDTAGRGASAEHRQDQVEIRVNNVPRTIHRGRRSVAEIKEIGKVAPADELSQLVDNRYVPLAQDGSVVIKGGEVFQSNPPAGGSS